MIQLKQKPQQSHTEIKYNELIDKQWLVTNNRGSFASSSLCGNNTSKYHCLLTGSLEPPSERVQALNCCIETIHHKAGRYDLTHPDFSPPSVQPSEPLPVSFRKDTGIHYEYSTELFELTKSVYLLNDSDVIAICYDFTEVQDIFDIELRPLASLRSYHGALSTAEGLSVELNDDYLTVSSSRTAGRLILSSEDMAFIEQHQWWYNFFYKQEHLRGQECTEHLFSPGIFRRTIDGPVRIVLWAGFGDTSLAEQINHFDVDVVIDDLRLSRRQSLCNLKSKDSVIQMLASSANDFIIDRYVERAKTKSILAGFPWFMDWGRDTFIALPGLLLNTERFSEAADVLLTFAYNADEGMIANCFGDYNSNAHYNSIDASLWFINSAFAYLRTSADSRTFTSRLMPVIRWIIDSYRDGTKFGIKADEDGLITGGDKNTQLTWMDAKCGDTCFTPRYGKAVEINALWYNAICLTAEFYRSKDGILSKQFSTFADRIAGSFRDCFWNEAGGYLYDCVNSDFSDSRIRPNQIFAVSLPYSPLSSSQQQSVVSCVEKHLLTPFGLRTLSPDDSGYIGHYKGDSWQRDSAYHNGTAWPWLLGGFVEAYLKVNSYSKQSKKQCLIFLEPLLDHFRYESCIGSISEIFDGDAPYNPGGAFAQAWSVAEILRAYMLCQ